MGNCCSSIHKKKKRHRRDDVYDPEDVNQKMIYETSSTTYNTKKKEMTTFNTETVKAALEQVQNGQDVSDEVEEEEEDEEASSVDAKQLHHSPKTKQQQQPQPNNSKGGSGGLTSAKTAPLPKTVGMNPALPFPPPLLLTLHYVSHQTTPLHHIKILMSHHLLVLLFSFVYPRLQ